MKTVTDQFTPLDPVTNPKVIADAVTHHLINQQQTQNKAFPPLSDVTSTNVSTNAAAYYLNRKSQTLRSWACLENGPLRPIRINSRLAWSVVEIKKLTGAI
jgi:hypothetical protein